MEEKIKDQQEIKDDIGYSFTKANELPRYLSYKVVSRFKSIRRAIKRGKVDLYTGLPFPRRPFNNRKPTLGRKFNELKKLFYGKYAKRTV